MRKVLSQVIAFATAFVLTACGGSAGYYEPTDQHPRKPKKVARKYIDPPHYTKTRTCKTKVNGKCTVWKVERVLIDDRDWVLVTSDGVHYDVSEDEYNRVHIGDYWK